jgi:hypothetical protein
MEIDKTYIKNILDIEHQRDVLTDAISEEPLLDIIRLMHPLNGYIHPLGDAFDINQQRREDGGGPVLNKAVYSGRSDVICELARHFNKIKASAADCNGDTAMHVAMQVLDKDEDSYIVVQQLLLLPGGMISLQMGNRYRQTPMTILESNSFMCPRTRNLIRIGHECLQTALSDTGIDQNKNLHSISEFETVYLQSRCDLQIAKRDTQMKLSDEERDLESPLFLFQHRHGKVKQMEHARGLSIVNTKWGFCAPHARHVS